MVQTPTRVTRTTSQKKIVKHALDNADAFMSARQLHSALKADGTTVALATIYRQLGVLADAEAIDKITVEGEHLYRACANDKHHHHLVCEQCGRSEILDSPLEKWMDREASDRGFRVTRHVLEVFGICANCDS